MTSADLLLLFNDVTGRAAADTVLDPKKYTWLSRAQDEVVSEIATIAPWVLYQKTASVLMPVMTPDAAENVFTFGVDGSGNPIVPVGSVQVYRKITDVPDLPLRPNFDYLPEGTQIRLPRNRSYAGPLYWRGIVFPAAITALVNPGLVPTQANELTAIRAARNFAESGNLRNVALADRMERRWSQRFPYWMLVLRKQFSKGGALTAWSLKDVVTPLL